MKFGNTKSFFLLLASAYVMFGCVAMDKPLSGENKEKIATIKVPNAAAGEVKPSNEAVKPSSSSGGYYQDDGPCSNPPTDLDTRPDAQPRVEAFLSGPNRPYVALGQRYVPEVSMRAFRQTGKASWYGCKYHGQTTSSGEVFDTYQMTAAHPILPIPSYVRVTNLENQKSVVVRINDRGPFVANRVIDLSYLAARRIGLIEKGTGDVEVERVFALATATSTTPATPATSATPAPVSAPATLPNQIITVIPAQAAPVIPAQSAPLLVPPAQVPVPVAVIAPKPAPVAAVVPATSPLSAVAPRTGPQIFLQFGAFVDAGKAEQERLRLTQRGGWRYPINVLTHSGLYKIVMGPIPSEPQAQQEKKELLTNKITTFVVTY